MTRCLFRLVRCAAIPLMIAALSRSAAACSLRAPWEINDPLMIAFMGSPLSDTVLAGDGSRRPVVAMGHSGAGAPRVAYGQRVRVDRVGDRARNALPRDTREVVLVPWDYAADCSPVAWGRSARWLPDSLSGLFRARLRPRAQWARGIPTFDITGTHFQPYSDRPSGATVFDVLSSRESRLSAPALLSFYDALPPLGVAPDTLAALQWITRMRADTALANRYPVGAFTYDARAQFESARAKAIRVPVAGTFRLDVLIDSLPPRTLFLRVSAAVSSLQDSARGIPDTALVPRLPEGYYISTAAAKTIDQLPTQCREFDHATIAYVDLDWHVPMPADGTGEWKGGIDERLLELLLSSDERERWQARRRAAFAATADSLRTMPDSVRALDRNRLFIFIPDRPLRISQDAVGPMRIEGAITIPLLGVFRIRGERISRDPLPCQDGVDGVRDVDEFAFANARRTQLTSEASADVRRAL